MVSFIVQFQLDSSLLLRLTAIRAQGLFQLSACLPFHQQATRGRGSMLLEASAARKSAAPPLPLPGCEAVDRSGRCLHVYCPGFECLRPRFSLPSSSARGTPQYLAELAMEPDLGGGSC